MFKGRSIDILNKSTDCFTSIGTSISTIFPWVQKGHDTKQDEYKKKGWHAKQIRIKESY